MIYGEICGPGIQGNIYRLSEPTVFVFDIKINGQWLAPAKFVDTAYEYGLTTVPILSEGITLENWLNGKTIKQASNGESKLFKTDREGIVIRPMKEQYCELLKGRLVLKQRSPVYLSLPEQVEESVA